MSSITSYCYNGQSRGYSFSGDGRRGKPELILQGRKGSGQIQQTNHMNEHVGVWEYGRLRNG